MAYYQYSCTKCGGTVTKTPTGQTKGKGGYSGLHGWSCDTCGRGIKVSRALK